MQDELSQHLELMKLESIDPNLMNWMTESYAQLPFESFKQALEALKEVITTNPAALPYQDLSFAETFVNQIAEIGFRDKSGDIYEQNIYHAMSSLWEHAAHLSSASKSLSADHPFFQSIIQDNLERSLRALEQCIQIKETYAKLDYCQPINAEKAMFNLTISPRIETSNEKLTQDIPYCHSRSSQSIELGTVESFRGEDISFLHAELKQYHGPYSKKLSSENPQADTNTMTGIVRIDNFVSYPYLIPVGSGLVKVEAVGGQNEIHFNQNALTRLSLSDAKPLGTLSIAARTLRDKLITTPELSQSSVDRAFSQYFSNYIYVTSDDVHQLMNDIAKESGLMSLSVYELLHIGQCNSMSMLANYLTQDILKGGYANGFSIEQGVIESEGAHTQFVYQLDSSSELHSFETTAQVKNTYKNLELSDYDKSTLGNLVKDLKDAASSDKLTVLLGIRSYLHKRLESEDYNHFKPSTRNHHAEFKESSIGYTEGMEFSVSSELRKFEETLYKLENVRNFNIIDDNDFICSLLEKSDGAIKEIQSLIEQSEFSSVANTWFELRELIGGYMTCAPLIKSMRTHYSQCRNGDEKSQKFEQFQNIFNTWLSRIALQSEQLLKNKDFSLANFTSLLNSEYSQMYLSFSSVPALYKFAGEQARNMNIEDAVQHAKQLSRSALNICQLMRQTESNKASARPSVDVSSGKHISHSKNLLLEDPFDIKGFREYQPGDPVERIHWSKFTTNGNLVVKEYGPQIDLKNNSVKKVSLNIELSGHKLSEKENGSFTTDERLFEVAAALYNLQDKGFQLDRIKLSYHGSPILDEKLNYLVKKSNEVNTWPDKQAFVEKVLCQIANAQLKALPMQNHVEHGDTSELTEKIRANLISANRALQQKDKYEFERENFHSFLNDEAKLDFCNPIYWININSAEAFLKHDINSFLQSVTARDLVTLIDNDYCLALDNISSKTSEFNLLSSDEKELLSGRVFSTLSQSGDIIENLHKGILQASQSPDLIRKFEDNQYRAKPCLELILAHIQEKIEEDLELIEMKRICKDIIL